MNMNEKEYGLKTLGGEVTVRATRDLGITLSIYCKGSVMDGEYPESAATVLTGTDAIRLAEMLEQALADLRENRKGSI